MKDNRDPEVIGKLLIQLKEVFPYKTICEIANMVEERPELMLKYLEYNR